MVALCARETRLRGASRLINHMYVYTSWMHVPIGWAETLNPKTLNHDDPLSQSFNHMYVYVSRMHVPNGWAETLNPRPKGSPHAL